MISSLEVLVILFLLFGSPSATAATHSLHSSRALVRFVATSTSIRSSYAGSEDVFLAEASFGKEAESPILVKLVDRYPPYKAPIKLETLVSPPGTWLHLRRDVECDVALSAMPLRTAPGDPTAVLAESLVFRPQLPPSAKPDSMLPCYRIVR